MSLKSIKVAIPKTTDVTKMQHQQILKPQHDQLDEGSSLQKKQVRDAKRSTEIEGSKKATIKDKQDSSEPREQKRKKQDPKEESEGQATHPYKGRSLDISL